MVRLVCLDRDGTINEDDNYYLGSNPDWRNQVKILEGVVEGIKKLNLNPDTHVFIVTNQSGVALQGPRFDELTQERMHEVNKYILTTLKERGANVRGYFACPFVDDEYVRKAISKRREVNPTYIKNRHRDLKPNVGMLEKCALAMGKNLDDVDLYVIGDRKSDVELGLNGGGTGILIASEKTRELGDIEKVESLKVSNPNSVYVARNFLNAIDYIISS